MYLTIGTFPSETAYCSLSYGFHRNLRTLQVLKMVTIDFLVVVAFVFSIIFTFWDMTISFYISPETQT